MSSAPRKAALAFIFVTVAIDVLSIGIIIPVLPKLIEQFAGGDTAQAAQYVGLFGMAWALMQFFCSPILGALSDRFGRRAVILLSCFGLGLDFLMMAIAPTLAWLFVGRLLSGMFAASFATANAYIADITVPEKRAGAFGIMGAAWGLGFVLGPALGGVLGEIAPRLPFWVAAGLALTNALYGLFVLPESLPRDKRRAFSWKRANPVGALKLLRSHRELLGLAAVNLLYFTAYHALPSVFVLYVGLRYGWSTQTVGLMLAAVGVSNAIVQGFLVKRIVARIGERRALLCGALAGALGYLLYAFAPNGMIFALSIPVFAFIGLYGPSVQALMTRRIPAGEQGQLQGANGSITAITGLYGPGIFSFTFAYFITPHRGLELPGAPYLLASLILFAAAALAWRVTRNDPSPSAAVAGAAAPGPRP